MIALDDKTLRALQQTELELLTELDRVCRENGIEYHIIAGTMLGAVRHGGFIPWDDDADVAMLRPEYERFRTLCQGALDPDRFVFQDHQCTPGYRWGYGKLRRRGTLFVREHQEHMPYEQGVFLDVFPLDPVPDSRLGRVLMDLKCFCIRKLLWARVGKEAAPTAGQRRLYALLDRIPEERVLQSYDRLVARTKRIRSGWVRILMFPAPNRQCGYLRRWYEGGEPILFEGIPFPGVSDPDGYLRFKYGDYMTPPPVGRRKAHPVSAIRPRAEE